MENIQATFDKLNNNILEINNGTCNALESHVLKGLIDRFDEVVKDPTLRVAWTACVRNVRPLSRQDCEEIQKVINTIIHADFSQNPKVSLICAKHHVDINTYNDFMQKYKGDIYGKSGDMTPVLEAELTNQAGILKVLKDLIAKATPAAPAQPSTNYKLQENTFETVTRMMSREHLQAVMNESAGREKQINDLSRILQLEKGKPKEIWQGIISRYKKEGPDFLVKDGLIAFRDGSISMEQFCTLTVCWSLMKEFPESEIHVQPLFDATGNPDPHAKASLERSLYLMDAEWNFFTREEAARISDIFFENMKAKDPSETVFFSIDGVSKLNRSIGAIFIDVGFRACNDMVDSSPSQEEESFTRMIPSFSMVQGFVDACGQENTIAPSPVIGFSAPKDIYDNIIKHGREVLLPFPGITYRDERSQESVTEYIHPVMADGVFVESYIDFFYHDLYHCVLVSYVPDACRQEIARLATRVESIRDQCDVNSFRYHFLNALYDGLVDMEFTYFRPDIRKIMEKLLGSPHTEGEIFICQLHHLIRETIPIILNDTRKRLVRENILKPDITWEKELQNLEANDPIFKEIVYELADGGFFDIHPFRESALKTLHGQAGFRQDPENGSLIYQVLRIYGYVAPA